jgi:hypothetical protein
LEVKSKSIETLRKAAESDEVIAVNKRSAFLVLVVLKPWSDSYLYRLHRYERQIIGGFWEVTVDDEKAHPDDAMYWLFKDFEKEAEIDLLKVAEEIVQKVRRDLQTREQIRREQVMGPRVRLLDEIRRENDTVLWRNVLAERRYLVTAEGTTLTIEGTYGPPQSFDLLEPDSLDKFEAAVRRSAS